MRKVEERLKEFDHDIREHPNCSLRFEARLPGKGNKILDKKPIRKTSDIVEYGKTRRAAIWKALRTKKELG